MLPSCGPLTLEPSLVLLMLAYCQLEAAYSRGGGGGVVLPSLSSFLPYTPMLPLMYEEDGWISK